MLYALVSPASLRAATLLGEEAARFFFGLRIAYLVGAVLAALAAVTSIVGAPQKQGESGI